ncbi:MAG TPA: DUF2950 domain-containing protein, partial [Xanthomonadales bacterium]|nr:DUF2950 domain-containing protein [Xanthomonadales bacterium]
MRVTTFNHFRLLTMLALLILLVSCKRSDPGLFETPEAAVQAMAGLVGQQDDQALEGVFGPGSAELFHSGDTAADMEDAQRVKSWIEDKVEFEEFDENTRIALLGEDAWPFPIPLVRDGEGWRFSTGEGREELLNRRIGRNELWTLAALHEVVEAQREFYTRQSEGQPQAFATRFISSEGNKDGLYWPDEDGTDPSPLGDALAESEASRSNDEPQPFHGYFYRILTEQGANAPGGAYDYLNEDGLLTRGFAVIAWPAKYGNSGVMTFITNHRGLIWQKDLGEDSATLAESTTSFDHDSSWTPTGDFM